MFKKATHTQKTWKSLAGSCTACISEKVSLLFIECRNSGTVSYCLESMCIFSRWLCPCTFCMCVWGDWGRRERETNIEQMSPPLIQDGICYYCRSSAIGIEEVKRSWQLHITKLRVNFVGNQYCWWLGCTSLLEVTFSSCAGCNVHIAKGGCSEFSRQLCLAWIILCPSWHLSWETPTALTSPH